MIGSTYSCLSVPGRNKFDSNIGTENSFDLLSENILTISTQYKCNSFPMLPLLRATAIIQAGKIVLKYTCARI
jgi:hypothetical protein